MSRKTPVPFRCERLALVGYLLDQAERELPLPSHPRAPHKVCLELVAAFAGIDSKVFSARANRDLVERWADVLDVWPTKWE